MDVNLKSVFLMVKHSLPWLHLPPQPTVVNIGSVSSFVAQQRTPAYVASKGAYCCCRKRWRSTWPRRAFASTAYARGSRTRPCSVSMSTPLRTPSERCGNGSVVFHCGGRCLRERLPMRCCIYRAISLPASRAHRSWWMAVIRQRWSGPLPDGYFCMDIGSDTDFVSAPNRHTRPARGPSSAARTDDTGPATRLSSSAFPAYFCAERPR